jgi:raffinose/stachyose/melibiose transport system substrate-binding protein
MKASLLKGFGAILLSAAITLSISACSTHIANTSSTTSTKPAPVKLTFSTYNTWWNYDSTKIAIEMYQDQTGNSINPQIYPDGQFISVMQAKLATGDTPDIVAINNVTPFTKSELTPLTGPWVSNLDKSRLAINGYGFDNTTVYGAPYGADGFQGLMYNTKIFQQAGITLPLATYTDFVNACKAIKALPGNIIPLSVPNGDPWPGQIALYTGSMYLPIVEPNLVKGLYTNQLKPQSDAGLLDMINRVLTLKKDGYTNADMSSQTMAVAEKNLANGKTAMAFGGNWCYADFLASYQTQLPDISMTAVNWGDDAADLSVMQNGSGNCLMIPVSSKQKAGAQDFINFVLSAPVMKAMFALSPGVNDIGVDTQANPWDASMQALVTSGKAKVRDMVFAAVADYSVGTGFNSGNIAVLGQSIFNGEDPVKALTEMYTDYAQQNKAKGIPGF